MSDAILHQHPAHAAALSRHVHGDGPYTRNVAPHVDEVRALGDITIRRDSAIDVLLLHQHANDLLGELNCGEIRWEAVLVGNVFERLVADTPKFGYIRRLRVS